MHSMTLTKIEFLDMSEVNRMCMQEHSSWSIPYGYRMDDWVIVWWSTLVCQPSDMLWLLGLKLCRKLQKESQLEYCVQEPNEAWVGDDRPPILVHMAVGDMYGCL